MDQIDKGIIGGTGEGGGTRHTGNLGSGNGCAWNAF